MSVGLYRYMLGCIEFWKIEKWNLKIHQQENRDKGISDLNSIILKVHDRFMLVGTLNSTSNLNEIYTALSYYYKGWYSHEYHYHTLMYFEMQISFYNST